MGLTVGLGDSVVSHLIARDDTREYDQVER